MRWVKAQGGVAAMAAKNEAKAQLLYGAIDNSFVFPRVAATEDRSRMNVTFIMKEGKEDLATDLLAACEAAGCVGVKGHRSVGGFRASIYNAMPPESVAVLADVLKTFDQAHG